MKRLYDHWRKGGGLARLAQIERVHREIINGRPQIIIDVKDVETGRVQSFELDYKAYQALVRQLGPHPTVERHFKRGEGLQ